MAQRVLEIESKEPRIFSDHCRRDDIKNVIIRFLRDLIPILRKQAPEVAIPGIIRKTLNQWNHLPLAPVVRRHDEQAGGLSVGQIDIAEISRSGPGRFLEIVTLVS